MWVRPDEFITDVLEKLEFEDVGALIVSSDGEKIEGIISERDVVRGMRYYGPEVLERKVCDLMKETVVTCRLSATAKSAMASMSNRQIRHLPVIANKKLVGILSVRDFIGLCADQL